MSAAGPQKYWRERRLFRLFIGLKVVFWVIVLTVLIIGIVNTATGRHSGPPTVLIWSLPLLAALQLAVWLAWRHTRRSRQRGGAA